MVLDVKRQWDGRKGKKAMRSSSTQVGSEKRSTRKRSGRTCPRRNWWPVPKSQNRMSRRKKSVCLLVLVICAALCAVTDPTQRRTGCPSRLTTIPWQITRTRKICNAGTSMSSAHSCICSHSPHRVYLSSMHHVLITLATRRSPDSMTDRGHVSVSRGALCQQCVDLRLGRCSMQHDINTAVRLSETAQESQRPHGIPDKLTQTSSLFGLSLPQLDHLARQLRIGDEHIPMNSQEYAHDSLDSLEVAMRL